MNAKHRIGIADYMRARAVDAVVEKNAQPAALTAKKVADARMVVKQAKELVERAQVKRLYAAKAAEDQRLVAKKAADARTEKKAAANAMDAYLSGK